MNFDLFDTSTVEGTETLGRHACVLRRFALPFAHEIAQAMKAIEAAAPFRHMVTSRGHTMSVALTNCGELGWVSDRRGYRYSAMDPATGRPWPAMPQAFRQLAAEAAQQAGLGHFEPDACLMNRYLPGSGMGLHQDRNEKSLIEPIVSVSLGIPAVFLFGGCKRTDKPRRVPLFHGDVVVWGGEDRMRFHGILPLKPAHHGELGAQRYNLTFRRAG
ncbi:MAG TPA: DNA oxidative demethylase AlkB [Pusillimonas sp.]|uniref:DNA oxidative demethylase AlkB n=1 Tax=Pusillimonas sp. TaxID=3040095 RepID=UPI002D076951|nr:DNA oxidative demethylase AlkB [Pusillimonas sp.]HUH88706.1 DNA oxidative demethylase AlkB [Pusillimonas sp.]